MTQYLFQLSIGPVQDFIAQARKPQDLFGASQLLSQMAYRAALAIRKLGGELVFPYLEAGSEFKERQNPSFPNKLVAIFQAEELQELQKGEQLEKNLREAGKAIADSTFKDLKSEILKEDPDYAPEIETAFARLAEQTERLWEIYWVAVPMRRGEYAADLLHLERLFGSIKRVRQFRQLPDPERGRKCSLDGQNDALLARQKLDRSTPAHLNGSAYVVRLESQAVSRKQLDRGEALGGPGLLKRLHASQNGFPSTAEVALMHLFNFHENQIWTEDQRKEAGQLKSTLQQFRDAFRDDFDFQMLYEENLTADSFEGVQLKNGDKRHPLAVARAYQEQIRNCAEKLGLKYNRFYAFLSFDADSMGEHLAQVGGVSEHLKTSKALTDFAEEARRILDGVKDHSRGRAVYAGGDDFLGMVNPRYMFEVLQELRAVFKSRLSDKGFAKSLSLGMALAHYKTPLQLAIRESRAMLQEAKGLKDKDATGINFLKPGGSVGKATVKNSKMDVLAELLQAAHEKRFNTRFIFDYHRLFQLWDENKFDRYADHQAHMALSEAEFIRMMSDGKKDNEALASQAYANLAEIKHSTFEHVLNLKPLFSAMHLIDTLNTEMP